MKPYKVGDKVWHATHEFRDQWIVCPICDGQKTVTLLLGNGDHCVLPCEHCRPNICEPPCGSVREQLLTVKPELRTITAVNIRQNEDGEEREYLSHHFLLRDEDIFDTEQDALPRCTVVHDKWLEHWAQQCGNGKAYSKKNFSQKAGYHLRCVKDLLRQIEYHERMAVLCKARSKDGGDAATE